MNQQTADDGSPLGTLIPMITKPYLYVVEDARPGLQNLLKQSRIRVYTWHHTSAPFCDLNRREIKVGWPFCERLWAHLCAYLCVFEWYENASRPQSITPFLESTEFAPILRLYKWALLSSGASSRIPWPTDTPRPPATVGLVGSLNDIENLLSPDLVDHFEGRVTRAFQRGIAWMILHELCHLLGGHVAPHHIATEDRAVYSTLQEQQADHWASQTSLTGVKGDNISNRLTLLGIIGTLTMLTSCVLLPFNRRIDDRTHADPPTRLRSFLKTFFPERSFGWLAASVFLEFELWAQQMPTAQSEALGTDAHLCKFFENIGGHVLRS